MWRCCVNEPVWKSTRCFLSIDISKHVYNYFKNIYKYVHQKFEL